MNHLYPHLFNLSEDATPAEIAAELEAEEVAELYHAYVEGRPCVCGDWDDSEAFGDDPDEHEEDWEAEYFAMHPTEDDPWLEENPGYGFFPTAICATCSRAAACEEGGREYVHMTRCPDHKPQQRTIKFEQLI